MVTIDGKTTRTVLKPYDLEKLVAFAKKKLKWEAARGKEYPLKDALPRIRELLGVANEKK